jgi:hypothetical protein
MAGNHRGTGGEARPAGPGYRDRLVQYAKGLATERGWARLETVVARKRESNRRGFLLSRGFIAGDCVTYRWGMHEGRHHAPPIFSLESRSSEVV